MPAADQVCKVPFPCTGNSFPLVLDATVFNHVGNSRFRGVSAGSGGSMGGPTTKPAGAA